MPKNKRKKTDRINVMLRMPSSVMDELAPIAAKSGISKNALASRLLALAAAVIRDGTDLDTDLGYMLALVEYSRKEGLCQK